MLVIFVRYEVNTQLNFYVSAKQGTLRSAFNYKRYFTICNVKWPEHFGNFGQQLYFLNHQIARILHDKMLVNENLFFANLRCRMQGIYMYLFKLRVFQVKQRNPSSRPYSQFNSKNNMDILIALQCLTNVNTFIINTLWTQLNINYHLGEIRIACQDVCTCALHTCQCSPSLKLSAICLTKI